MISVIYSHPGTILIGIAITFSMLYWSFKSISLCVRRQKFKAEHGCQPVLHHYPHRDPILGLDYIRANLTALKHKNYLNTVTKRFHDIGATFDVRVITQSAIVTAEPENIKAVLALRFQDFTLGNRPQIMGDFLGRGIFTTDGSEWAHSRAMLRPNFVKEQVGDLKALERHVQNLFRLIPLDGSTVDLQPLFFRFALDSATEFLFGDSVCSLRQSAEANHSFGQAFNYSMGELALRFRLGPFVAFRRNKKATEAFRVCRAYVDRFVDDAMKYRQNHEMKDFAKEGTLFLQELAKATDSKERIRDELLNILVAGRDTTASLLSHLVFEISRKPDVWGCLQKEASFLEGKLPTYQQLKGMKYLKFTVQETLRLHPPVPTNVRLCVNDTVLPVGGGRFGDQPIFVPKGCLVVYTVYAMHRRKDYFGEDVEEFRPERWEGQRHSWEYLPFNGGPRTCLGQQYAVTEASYVLVRMLQEYKGLETRDLQPWTESLSLTVCSENGVKVVVTPA